MMLKSTAIMRLFRDNKVDFKGSNSSHNSTLSLVAAHLAGDVADVAVVVGLFKPF